MVLHITDALCLFCAPSGPRALVKIDGIMKYQDILAQNMFASAKKLDESVNKIMNQIILYTPINNTEKPPHKISVCNSNLSLLI